MSQINIGLRLDVGMVERIDAARGDVPRARWISHACERHLDLCAMREMAREALGPGGLYEGPYEPA